VELEIMQCGVQLCAGSEHFGLLHGCTALTKLELCCATLLDVAQPGSRAPAAVAQLKHLVLDCWLPKGQSGEQVVQALRERLAPHLTSLTCLGLMGNTDGLLTSLTPHVSTIRSLHTLSIERTGEGRV
jgi:hypothetical protein